MTLTIEQAQPADVPVISGLIEEIESFYGVTEIAPMSERIEQVKALLFHDLPVARVLLARDGDHVVGMAAYSYLWPAAGSSHSMFLKELFVRADARRRGVASLLMNTLQGIAARNGCTRLEWQTDRGNIAAEKFYEAFGAQRHEGKIIYRVSIVPQ